MERQEDAEARAARATQLFGEHLTEKNQLKKKIALLETQLAAARTRIAVAENAYLNPAPNTSRLPTFKSTVLKSRNPYLPRSIILIKASVKQSNCNVK